MAYNANSSKMMQTRGEGAFSVSGGVLTASTNNDGSVTGVRNGAGDFTFTYVPAVQGLGAGTTCASAIVDGAVVHQLARTAQDTFVLKTWALAAAPTITATDPAYIQIQILNENNLT
jgi:hypothetical protein